MCQQKSNIWNGGEKKKEKKKCKKYMWVAIVNISHLPSGNKTNQKYLFSGGSLGGVGY